MQDFPPFCRIVLTKGGMKLSEDIWEQVKALVDIGEESGEEALIEGLFLEQVPVIGKIISTIKYRRLSKRLKDNEQKIKKLSTKVNNIDDADFIDFLKNFLFPSILQNIMEEDEDAKIGYFLDGFEQVIDEEVVDKSKILIMYDLLRELRYIEIEYLISFSSEYKVFEMDYYYDTGEYVESHFNHFDTKTFNEIKPAIEIKLERLGLLDTERLLTYKEIKEKIDESVALSSKFNYFGNGSDVDLSESPGITSLGNQFLDFFYLVGQYKRE